MKSRTKNVAWLIGDRAVSITEQLACSPRESIDSEFVIMSNLGGECTIEAVVLGVELRCVRIKLRIARWNTVVLLDPAKSMQCARHESLVSMRLKWFCGDFTGRMPVGLSREFHGNGHEEKR